MAREQSTALDELWDQASKSHAWPSLASDDTQLRPSAVSQPAPSSTILSASHFVAGVVGQFRHQLQDHRLNKDRAAGHGTTGLPHVDLSMTSNTLRTSSPRWLQRLPPAEGLDRRWYRTAARGLIDQDLGTEGFDRSGFRNRGIVEFVY
jgi:hypothetical protein